MKPTTKKPRTKPTKDTPAPRCELCGRQSYALKYGLCATCLTGKHRRSA